MAVVYVAYTGNGSQTDFTFPFPYLRPSHVIVALNGVETTNFTLPTTSSVRITPAPAVGVSVLISRRTESAPMTSWPEGSNITGRNLDLAQLQSLFIAQEARGFAAGITLDLAAVVAARNDAQAAEIAAEAARDQALAVALQDATTLFAHTVADSINSGFDGVDTTHAVTLAGQPFEPQNAASLVIHLNGVYQKPGVDYTVAGNVITFATAPVAGDECHILVLRTTGTANELPFTPVGGIVANTLNGAFAELDGEIAALDAGKANASHAHPISDVTNLQTTLDGKAPSSHGHPISDVSNLQTTLDGKAASSHTHVANDISDATAVGKDVLKATDQAAARAAIGVGLGTGDLVAANNLSDVANAGTARGNLGLQTVLIDSIAGSFNDVTTAFTLNVSASPFTPRSVNNVFVLLNGVLQEPGVAFTLSGSTLTFSVAPASGDSCRIWVIQV